MRSRHLPSWGRLLTALLAMYLNLADIPVRAENRGPAGAFLAQDASGEVSVLQEWNGDYPVAGIDRLPAGQQEERTGFIEDPKTFAAVWEAFKPGEKAPEVDFAVNLVIFSRNVDFYNRLSIAKVTLEEGVVEVIIMETLTSTPIEDKVAMSFAVIPRGGVEFISSGGNLIPVQPPTLKRVTFFSVWIRSGKVRLREGEYRETEVPGSASRIRVKMADKRAFGFINGLPAAAVVLITDPGASGTFYALSLLFKEENKWVNVDTHFLGDRVRLQDIDIAGNQIVVNMTVHAPGEGMCCPTLRVKKHFAVRENRVIPAGEEIIGLTEPRD